MKEDLQLFSNPQFGDVRIMNVDGVAYFVANDVARALGYSNPSKATNDHCKKAVMRWGNDSLGRNQEFKIIPESDVFRLIVKSKLPSAELFEKWLYYLLSVKTVAIFTLMKTIVMKILWLRLY